MSEITIQREVVFTDYEFAETSRIEVAVTLHDGCPVANIRMPAWPLATFAGGSDIREPDVLRSYAKTMLAAADEMERMEAFGEVAA